MLILYRNRLKSTNFGRGAKSRCVSRRQNGEDARRICTRTHEEDKRSLTKSGVYQIIIIRI